MVDPDTGVYVGWLGKTNIQLELNHQIGKAGGGGGQKEQKVAKGRRKEVPFVGTSLQVPFGYWFIDIHTLPLDRTEFISSKFSFAVLGVEKE